jgi:hypothetical protein
LCYQLPQVFEGKRDWRAYRPSADYEDKRITVRRSAGDPGRPRAGSDARAPRRGRLRHAADASGGSYLPPRLSEYVPLFNYFGTYRRGGTAGRCPMAARRSCKRRYLGIDVAARRATGYQVLLITSEQVILRLVAPATMPLIGARARHQVVENAAMNGSRRAPMATAPASY